MTTAEKRNLINTLLENYRPENREYRYNFVYDNCATRPRDKILAAIEGHLILRNDVELKTYRQWFNSYAGNGSWLNFGLDLVFGMKADKDCPQYESMFLPEVLMNEFKAAKILQSNNRVERPLVSQERILVTANPNWWGRSVPSMKGIHNFQTINLRFIQDSTIGIRSLENGEIDFLGLQPDEYQQKAVGPKWGKSVKKVKAENKQVTGYTFVGFNLTNPMFKSVKTREAMVHLFNRKNIIEKLFFNLSTPATGPLYPASDYADPGVKPIEFDPALALKKLNEDGWKDTDGDRILDKMIDGKKVKLSFTILEPLPDYVRYLTGFQQDAKKAGVDVQIKVVEWNAFIKLLDERKFEAVRLAWGGGDLDWDPKQIWHSDSIANSGSNFVSYSNPKVDKLIDESRVVMDKKVRITKLREVYRTIAADVPYIFLFSNKYRLYGHSERMGREKDAYTYGVGTDYWWIAK